MKICALVISAAAAWLVCARAADIPPFYPAPAAPAPARALYLPSEIDVTLPGGIRVEPKKFNAARSLNGDWKFSGLEKSAVEFTENPRGFEAPSFDDSKWLTMPVPGNWFRKYPQSYDRKESFVQGYYRHSFDLTQAELTNHRVLLHFEFIGYEAILWINGKRSGSHHGDFIPWTVDVTDFVRLGENKMMMQVITDFGPSLGAREKAVRTYGAQWDWTNIKGGIWGEVELRIEPEVRFMQLYTVPELDNDSLLLRAKVDNTTGKTVTAVFDIAVTPAAKEENNILKNRTGGINVLLSPGINVLEQTIRLDRPVRWSPDNPYLYYATAILTADNHAISAKAVRFGFRSFTVKDGKFHLNGRRIYLFGENLPSTRGGDPGVSPAEDAANYRNRLTKFKSLGYNMIRFAHMPVMPQALAAADEIGIMIYDEWSWCFTNSLEIAEFEKRNETEFLQWLDRDFNHPSVVMWSCGNEVRHAGNPELRALLDRQVQLVRQYDLQKRPAGSFSGSACWRGYGSERLVTDFLDHHSYVGSGEAPWTMWFDNFNTYYTGSLEQYGAKTETLDMPYILWELVGFSWGQHCNADFKINDTAAYAQYVKKTTSWGQPNGVGHIGSLGLAAAVDSNRANAYGQELYGHRILELLRQDPRVDGFAPWFHNHNLEAATLWNQPILVGLRDSGGLPPRNFFSDRPMTLELFTVNSTAKPLAGGTVKIRCQLSDTLSVPVDEINIGPIDPFAMVLIPVKLTVPAQARGNVQLRVVLESAGQTVSQNFYPVFIKDAAELAAPIRTGTDTPVALLDVGNADDVKTTAALLSRFGISFEIINGDFIPSKYRVAVIPAALVNDRALRLNRDEIFKWVETDGGTLLILEQGVNSTSIFAGISLTAAPNPLTDLVHPAHPVFRGLTPQNFDTWVNPDHGNSISVVLNPFIDNALATRGAMIGGAGVDSAVVEAVYGKGRFFWTQLNAVKLANSDSVAATYLYNVFEYILSGKIYDKVLPLDPRLRLGDPLDPATLTPIDLSGHVNRGFSDDRENDGLGGWTDQGANDFRNMPLGVQTAAGVRFEIIDPAKNNGKSCIVLRGSERLMFPAEATGITVNGKFSRLFFLHTAAWSTGDVGAYLIHYADGQSVEYPLQHGVNIGDWWMTSFLTDGAAGIMRENPTKPQVGTYVATWENPYPQKEIASFDFLSSYSPQIRRINFQPGRRAVPVLIAVTGEKTSGRQIAIQGPPDALKQCVLADGTTGDAWQIELPPSGEGKTPYKLLRFDRQTGKLSDYRYLTFWIKAETAGAIDLQLPETNWQGTLDRTIELTPGVWIKVRISLTEMGAKKFTDNGKELRGELFLFNGANRKIQCPRPKAIFWTTGFTLE